MVLPGTKVDWLGAINLRRMALRQLSRILVIILYATAIADNEAQRKDHLA